jgi:large-conductance mechanosensitive channel
MVHNSFGYGMGFPWHWIIGLIILGFVVFIVIKVIMVRKRKRFDSGLNGKK